MSVSVRLAVTITGLVWLAAFTARSESHVPRIWDDAALEDWPTPIAALNVRPGHYSSAAYYKVPADNLRTYPVYPPDKEPAGYWEGLQKGKPAPLVDASAIHSTQEWIAAGERAFRDIDKVSARTSDPAILKLARDPATFAGADTLPDGSVIDLRWVITERGVELSIVECSACHRYMREDKSLMFAGPPDGPGERLGRRVHAPRPRG